MRKYSWLFLALAILSIILGNDQLAYTMLIIASVFQAGAELRDAIRKDVG